MWPLVKAACHDSFRVRDDPGVDGGPGKTGGDGIHYNSEASTEWATRVIIRLKRKDRYAGVFN